MNLQDVRNKIVIKLIVLILLSLVGSTLIFLILAHYAVNEFFANPSQFWNDSIAKYNLMILLIFLLSIATFIAIFVVPVNKKLGYIKYITGEVRKLALQPDLGIVVEIKGRDELAELGISINSLSRDLKQKFEQEREIENTKSELITNISHDLRSPLTSIIGYLDLIKTYKLRNQEDFEDYIHTIYSKSQSLKRLIDELFEYTKLSSSGIRLDCRRVEVNSFLAQILGEHIPIFEREGLTIKIDFTEEAEVDLDLEKMVRVFENLLENARKYSSKPSELRATLSKTTDKVRISLLNEVEKLPTKDPAKLFERFLKGDPSRTEENSSGLGLAIAKRILELHGGTIRAIYFRKAIEFVVEIPISKTLTETS